MLGIFRKKSAIDEDFFEWAICIAEWVIANFDGIEQLRQTPLVTPSLDFFPASREQGHDRALELFERVKLYADMADWSCELIPQDKRLPDEISDGVLQKFQRNAPLGTFSEAIKSNEIVSTITYDPSLTKKPTDLIATLSHELAHLLMTAAQGEFPFPPEMEEPATDSLAIMMGFGIFIANGSSGFRADDAGWEYHRSGYLCEGEILHVLSVFLFLSGNSLDLLKPFLKPALFKRVQKIHRDVVERPEVIALTSPTSTS